jgi:phospholipase A1
MVLPTRHHCLPGRCCQKKTEGKTDVRRNHGLKALLWVGCWMALPVVASAQQPGAGPATPVANATAAAADACPAGSSLDQCVMWCRDRYAGPELRDQRYACFDAGERAAGKAPQPAAAPAADKAAGPMPVESPKVEAEAANLERREAEVPLEQLWEEPDGIGFLPYDQSYVMFTYTTAPNDNPASPTLPAVGPPSDWKHEETKFEISLKTLILSNSIIGRRNSLWFAYTQESFWQTFDASNSRPFRENDYEPEVIFSHRLGDIGSSEQGLRPLYINVGAEHQSNGRTDPRSRSWNRIYSELGLVDRLSDTQSFAVLIRPWWRIHESLSSDNNPDINHYLGYGDIEFLYWRGDSLYTLLARQRSAQIDVSTPLLFLNNGKPKRNSMQLHFQVFTGYGESLIDYNQKHTTIGFGLSVPYGL